MGMGGMSAVSNVSNAASAGSMLSTAFSVASSLNPVLGAIGAVGSFVSNYFGRRKEKKLAQQRKKRGLRSEALLKQAAKNRVGRMGTEIQFLERGYNLAQQSAINQQRSSTNQALDAYGNLNLLSGGAIKQYGQLQQGFSTQQQLEALSREQGLYGIRQDTLSDLRDIQGNIIELSAYTGTKGLNVLNYLPGYSSNT